MLEKTKKIGIIIVIAVLFSMFVFSLVDVVMESPEYENFCGAEEKPIRPLQKDLECPAFAESTSSEREDCGLRKGDIEYSYDELGCPISYECNTCRALYEDASKQHRLIGFIITSVLGLIAVIIGMYIKSKKDIVEWVFSGIIIGGIASIFIGTLEYFGDMGRFVRPFVLLAEMAMIIWVAIKTSKKK